MSQSDKLTNQVSVLPNTTLSRRLSERIGFENQIALRALIGGLPSVLATLILLWVNDYSFKIQLTLGLLVVCFWLGFSFSISERITRPLQTLSNMLEALREGDYSVRARRARDAGALGEALREMNFLSAMLCGQRLSAMEATALMRAIVSEIDSAIFTFDNSQRLRIINRAGERLLNQPSERLIGKTAKELALEDCFETESQILERVFPSGVGRWRIHKRTFREGGLQHQLLVITDLSKTLRDEERKAWQRLVRVLGHELNNSLAPIKSLAESLTRLIQKETPPEDWKEDMKRGLEVISSRAESLTRFMDSYSRLTRLPPPKFESVRVRELIYRVVSLETRAKINIVDGEDIFIQADPAQLEQLLINLLNNAIEATNETNGYVEIGWHCLNSALDIWVKDEGIGITNPANLFVPFFTTKPKGSGIGLILSRQIAEAHGGVLTLTNQETQKGCIANLRLEYH